ncbi:galactosyltransferase-related protein, partial [Cetobacterium sp.]|uniref:galactosyltransferase-related protein n=1 Tax=Cetobacterium sp. TaxID=2071632 RepID=UPI003EE553CF
AHNTTEEEKKEILSKQEVGLDYSFIKEIIPEQYFKDMDWMYKKDRKRRILQRLFLNKRGIRLAGMSYGLFKEDYLKVNGYDEKYQGWGYEDDDFGNRLCIAGVKSRELLTDLIQLHLYHPFDPTKKRSLNEDYYYSRKKEIFEKKKAEIEFGIKNSIHSDTVTLTNLR